MVRYEVRSEHSGTTFHVANKGIGPSGVITYFSVLLQKGDCIKWISGQPLCVMTVRGLRTLASTYHS